MSPKACVVHSQLGVKMENVITLPFIDQFANVKTCHLILSIDRGLCRFCCIFLEFLSFEKKKMSPKACVVHRQ